MCALGQDDLARRVEKHQRYFYVGFAVAVIFGLSGGWGA